MMYTTTVDHTQYCLTQTDKFPVIAMEISFGQALEKEIIAHRNIVARVLPKILAAFPSKLATKSYFADLYATKIYSSTRKKGDMHEIVLQFLFTDPAVVQQPLYTLDSVFQCVAQVMFDPYLENGVFSETLVDIEIQNMKDKIARLYDDKMVYAQQRLLDHMFAESIHGLHSYGDITQYDHVTCQTAYQTYQKMLRENQITVAVVSRHSESEIVASFEQMWQRLPKYQRPQSPAVKDNRLANLTLHTYDETQQLNQAKLHIGYYVPTTISDSNYLVHRLAIEIFGGGSQSKLFQNVREKASLAYYVSATIDSYTEAMYVYAGIDSMKRAEVERIIDQQLNLLQTGDISDEEIDLGYKSLVQKMTVRQDSAFGLLAFSQYLLDLDQITSFEQWSHRLNSITKAEIVAAARTWQKKCVFILQPDAMIAKEEQ